MKRPSPATLELFPGLYSDPGQTHSGRFTDLDADKLRGGYYTPRPVADWLCAWAIRTKAETVLEPSCGDGIFLEATVDRLLDLGAKASAIADQVTGIEIHAAESSHARARLRQRLGPRGDRVIENEDFFAWWVRPGRTSADVVVGNPPFIRYQSFPEPHRSRAMAIMNRLGLAPNRLTNIWVPFVAAAAAVLRTGGRLALVLPAELLQVTYASQLRCFLSDRFARIDIVTCNELFFEKAEQEVVLVLAEGAHATASVRSACRIALTDTRTVAEITSASPSTILANAAPKALRHDHEKWLKYFLTQREIGFMRESARLRGSDDAENARDRRRGSRHGKERVLCSQWRTGQ